MKTCNKCKLDFPIDEFRLRRKDSDVRQPYCKACAKEYKSDHYKRNKAKVIAGNNKRKYNVGTKLYQYYKDHPCVDCGESDPVVLELDHVRGEKLSGVSKMVCDGYSFENILLEIAKCEVRCCNCHRRKTAQQFGWYKNLRV